MFENIDELIEVNLKSLYASKSHFMMRINFKDEFGFNLKNSKAFAEILVSKGLVNLEVNQGFRCDLTDLGKQIYQNGGWNKYLRTAEPFASYHTDEVVAFQVNKIKQAVSKRVMITSVIIVVLCFFITIITVEILKTS
jgi:hypothetical protein